MEIDELVSRLGGVVARKTLVAHFPVAQVQAAVASGRLIRIGHGTYALPQGESATRAARSLNGVLSLTSAALHHGWAVKTPPDRPHVMVPRHRKVSAARRRGVRLHHGDVEGGIATNPLQTVVDCGRFLPFDAALSVADSALRSGHVGKESLIRAAEKSPRTGRRAAVRVAEAADGRADNPFESIVRAISLEFEGLRLVPQVYITGYGRPDLYDERLSLRPADVHDLAYAAGGLSVRRRCPSCAA